MDEYVKKIAKKRLSKLICDYKEHFVIIKNLEAKIKIAEKFIDEKEIKDDDIKEMFDSLEKYKKEVNEVMKNKVILQFLKLFRGDVTEININQDKSFSISKNN